MTSLFLPLLPVGVFAEDSDFCNQVKNATCDSDLKSLSEDSRLKDCGGSIQSGLLTLVNKCKANLDKQKAQTESQLKNLETQQSAAERTLSNLTWNIKKLNTEIASLNLSLAELENAIQEREKAIKELDDALGQHKAILSEAIRQVYEYNTLSYIEMLLGYGTLSDFNQKLEEIDRLQKSLKSSMEEIRKAKEQMEKEKEELTQKKKEQEQYKAMQEMSKQSLALKQQQQKNILANINAQMTPLEQQMAIIEAELKSLQTAMAKIQSYLSQWVLQGTLTPEGIFRAVGNAAGLINGRPRAALLLGILQAESRLGLNLGKVRDLNEAFAWNPNQLSVYLDICKNLCSAYGGPYCKPESLPLSRDGAMGPAQFIPTSWKLFEKYVTAKFPGQVPNPWNLDHALVAMAAYVGRYSDEWTGVNCYGPGGCGGPAWYADQVIEYANDWQTIIDICGFGNLACSQLKSKLEDLGF